MSGKATLQEFSLQNVILSNREESVFWPILMYARTLYHNVKTTSLDDRFNLSFAKVRVSLIPATLSRYFFHPLSAFLSIG